MGGATIGNGTGGRMIGGGAAISIGSALILGGAASSFGLSAPARLGFGRSAAGGGGSATSKTLMASPSVLRKGIASWLKSRSEEHTSELQSLMRISYAVFCLKKHK